MALKYSAKDLQLLKPGAKKHTVSLFRQDNTDIRPSNIDDIVKKIYEELSLLGAGSSPSFANGSGTTFATNKYDLGGALTVDADITGASNTLDVRLGTSVDGLGHFEVNSIQGDQRYLSGGFGLTVVDNPGGRKSQITTAGSTTSYEITPGYFGVDYTGSGGTSALRINDDYSLTTNNYTTSSTNYSLSPTAGSTTVTDGVSTSLITIGAGTHDKTLTSASSTNTINHTPIGSSFTTANGTLTTAVVTNSGQLHTTAVDTSITATGTLNLQPNNIDLNTENTATNAKGSVSLGQVSNNFSYTDGASNTASVFQSANTTTISQTDSADPTIGLTLNQTGSGVGFTHLFGYNTNITLGASSSVFTDSRVGAAAVGFEYNADYSANFTVRSLVDKGYVNALIASGVTASNGLTKVTGDIQLGGALTKDADITGATNTHDIRLGTSTDGLGTFEVHATTSLHSFSSGTASSSIATNSGNFDVTVANTSSNTQSTINTDNNSTSLRSEKTSGDTEYGEVAVSSGGSIISGINPTTFADATITARNTIGVLLSVSTGGSPVSSLSMNFAGVTTYTDSHATTPTGIRYAADYSSTFTSRSLIDQAYATGLISTAAGNGLTENSGVIDLGSVITKDVEFTGAFDMKLGKTGSATDAISYFSGVTTTGADLYVVDNSGLPLSSMTLSTTSASLESTIAGGGTTAINGANITLALDSSTGAGAKYAHDYSANFTARSLIDLAHANSLISTATGAINTIFTGGTMAANSTITMATKSVTFSGGAVFVDDIKIHSDNINNTFIGRLSGDSNVFTSTTSGAQNTFVGASSGENNISGYAQSAFGFGALNTCVDGDRNTAIGYQSLFGITSGSNNTALGVDAGASATTSDNNVFIGYHTAKNFSTPSTGGNNVFVGAEIGQSLLNGDSNAVLGYRAAFDITSGHHNTLIGTQSGFNLTSGNLSTIVGSTAGQALTTEVQNVMMGYHAGQFTTSSFNTMIGNDALLNNVAGASNVALGHSAGALVSAGTANTSSTQSTFLGGSTRALVAGGSNEIVVGYNTIGHGTNTATWGNTSISKHVFSGNVGIGTSSPSERLEVTQSGSAVVDVVAVFGGIGNGNLGGRGTAIDIQVPGNESQEEGVRLIAETKGGQTTTQSADFVVQTANVGTLTERMRLTKAGDLALGVTTPTARLHVEGSGATSGTSALLIENSSGIDLLEAKDDGGVYIGVAPNTASSVSEILVRNTTTGVIEKASPSVIQPTLSKTLTLDAPTSSDNITIFRTDVAITVVEVIAVSTGTTPSTTYTLKHHTDRSNAGNSLTSSGTTTSTTTGDSATLSDATIPADSWIWLESTAASGTSVALSINIRYTED